VPHRTRLAAALVVLAAWSLVACSDDKGSTPSAQTTSTRAGGSDTSTTTPGSATSTGPGTGATANRPAPTPGVKPQLAGVLDRQGLPREKFWDELDGFVVSVSWADLQPQPFGPLATDNAIDKAIAAVRDGPTHLKLKLRVNAGVYSPEALKELTGGGVAASYAGYDKIDGTLPRFWTPKFAEAYADLQTRLAAAYDTVPEIEQVVVTQCMTFYAEPLLRQAGTPSTPKALLSAGYTVAADKQCHRSAIEAHRVWAHTRSSMAFNPYQVLGTNVKDDVDTDFSIEMMHFCRTTLGDRCVLENYSLAWPLRTGGQGNYGPIYAALKDIGPPLSFQTAAASRIGDWQKTLQYAVDVGAASVELNRGYPRYDLGELAALRTKLRANA
jgi:hypothetical protein